MQYKLLTYALIATAVLFLAGCGSTRQASERVRAESSELRESRDSLREEISQNLNENLTEHEVVTWTVVQHRSTGSGQAQDTLKVERVTDRERFQVSSSRIQDSKVEVKTVRDTVYVERVDTVEVQKFDLRSSSFAPRQYSSKLGTALGLASVHVGDDVHDAAVGRLVSFGKRKLSVSKFSCRCRTTSGSFDYRGS